MNFSLHKIHLATGICPSRLPDLAQALNLDQFVDKMDHYFAADFTEAKNKRKKKITYHYVRNFEILSQNFEVFSILNKGNMFQYAKNATNFKNYCGDL